MTKLSSCLPPSEDPAPQEGLGEKAAIIFKLLVPALRKQRQTDLLDFKAGLAFIVRPGRLHRETPSQKISE